ncbi:hypothetical protein Dimus_019523 [Dionaea muscipula]
MMRQLVGKNRRCGFVLCFTLTSLLFLTWFYAPPPIFFNINDTLTRHRVYPQNNDSTLASKQDESRQPQQGDDNDIDGHGCNLFKGEWVFDPQFSPLYTNSSCKTIPLSKNCFLNGRQDMEFLQWRWKPEKCELPRFEAKTFFTILTGKKMAFIGDSVARNQVESLLCLLAQHEEEPPVDVFKDAKDRSRTWYFPTYNFTLFMLWTKFLVAANERGINGSPTGIFDLQLDKVDENWANKLPPQLDYVVMSDSQWFYRKNYLYQGGRMIGCIYCGSDDESSNITEHGVEFAIGGALRSALSHINGIGACKEYYCSATHIAVTLVRTISPSHFENGTWKTGGSCNRTRPMAAMAAMVGRRKRGEYWAAVREAQLEEVERARRENGEGKGKKIRYEVLDVTWAMMLRPDGHPGSHWRPKQKKLGYNDCVHWCMPGPIDTWNNLLLATILRLADN